MRRFSGMGWFFAVCSLPAGQALAVGTPPGACCIDDFCDDLTEQECAGAGGTFLGEFTSCQAGDCSDLGSLGACCFSPEAFGGGSSLFVCALTSSETCDSQGGVFQGAGTTCDGVDCEQFFGACCVKLGGPGADFCVVLSGETCIASGGEYLSDETTCPQALCANFGACCFIVVGFGAPIPSCQLESEIDCSNIGGVFMGHETDCDPTPCAGVFGACCFDGQGECSDFLTENDCLNLGGAFVPGDLCDDVECAAAFGACCLTTLQCLSEVTAAECAGQSGQFFPGQTCDEAECDDPIIGACCLPTECIDGVNSQECVSIGGVFNGSGTTCTSDPCPQIGACCQTQGTCTNLTEASCILEGGVYLGDGVGCEVLICDTGACCLADSSCVLTSFEECLKVLGGEFLGAGTICSPQPCADPCGNPGRPDPDGTNETVVRGFIVGWAVNAQDEEIRFNHLSGSADVIHYERGSAHQYDAWAFQVVNPAIAHGQATGTPGELHFDGAEYAPAYDQLLMNFQAVGSAAFSSPSVPAITRTDLTLHPVTVDFTDGGAPVSTKAHFDVWNENEVKFSGAYRCVTCWDQTLLDDYGVPNHFLLYTLQSSAGKARIDGIASPLCEGSVDAAMLGVMNRKVDAIPAEPCYADTAAGLIGMGEQSAVLRFAPVSDPPESPAGGRGFRGSHGTEKSAEREPASRPQASGAGIDQDRVSASDKGSALYWSSVEVRWNAAGDLVQDTFLSITNDYPSDVRVLLYFVNGDAPYVDEVCQEFHPGWNFVDNEITLTANQPGYWSAATGLGTFGGLSPFTVLDP